MQQNRWCMVAVGWCSPTIAWQNISGGNDWIGWQAGQAWVYRSGGQYHTAAPPPGQGVAYGAGYASGDNITAIQHNTTTLEFLKNGISQGRIHLQVPLPSGAVGCASMCNGGSLAMKLQRPNAESTIGKAVLQPCSTGSRQQQWRYDALTSSFRTDALAQPGFLDLAVAPSGLEFAPVTVSSRPHSPFFWAPPSNFIRYDMAGDLGATGGTSNVCIGVCGGG